MREKIENILKEICNDYENYKGVDLWKDGVLDSFDIMNIVAKLEEIYEFEISAGDVVVGNFKNVDTIAEMVKKYVGINE